MAERRYELQWDVDDIYEEESAYLTQRKSVAGHCFLNIDDVFNRGLSPIVRGGIYQD